jgi:hypothetical protein
VGEEYAGCTALVMAEWGRNIPGCTAEVMAGWVRSMLAVLLRLWLNGGGISLTVLLR